MTYIQIIKLELSNINKSNVSVYCHLQYSWYLYAEGDRCVHSICVVGYTFSLGRLMVPIILSLSLRPTSPLLLGYFAHSQSHMGTVPAFWLYHAAEAVNPASSECDLPCFLGARFAFQEQFWWCQPRNTEWEEFLYWNKQFASWYFSKRFSSPLFTLSACFPCACFRIWMMCSTAPFDNGWYGGTSVCLTQFCLRKCVNSYEMDWGHCLKQLLWAIHMLQTKVSFGQYCSEQLPTSCAPPQPTWNGCQSIQGSSCHTSEQNQCVLFATPEQATPMGTTMYWAVHSVLLSTLHNFPPSTQSQRPILTTKCSF